MASPSTRRIAQISSHILVACGAVVLVVWLQGRGDDGQQDPPPDIADADVTAHAPAEQTGTVARAADTTIAAVPTTDADSSEEAGGLAGQAPIRIIATPEVLRVWHLTDMKLRAEPAQGEQFTDFTWHFGDGSEPVRGVEVDHTFPESVADRHITLQARRADGTKLVLSRRLPIERLAVVPLDGEEAPAWKLPRPRGRRLVAIGPCDSKTLERLLVAAAGPWRADGVLLVGDAQLADRARIIVDSRVQALPLLLFDVGPTGAGLSKNATPLRVIRDPAGEVKSLVRGGRSDVHILSGLALVAIDTRDEVDNVALRRLRADLEVATAFAATALLSARPLSPLRDGEAPAALAYRIYEQALRQRVRFVLSGRSRLAYDARYGGVGAISVGSVNQEGCHRPMGSDHCQAPSVSVVDIPDAGGLRAWHLRAPEFERRLDHADLPAEVGKYRR